MVSKYEGVVWEVLSFGEIQATNEIKQKVETIYKKVISWHMIYKILMDLYAQGKVEKLENRSGLFWRKK